MKIKNENRLIKKTPVISISLVLSAYYFAAPTYADEQSLEEVVVTGSHIRRKSQFDVASPTKVINHSDIAKQGASTISDITKNLSINSGADFQVDALGSNTTTGTANVNLRNLGTGSSLVLVNGRRQTVSSAASPDGSTFVDTNALMPAIMIERIEILKDGAASTYGSDAVAGVVNFISRNKFTGFNIEFNHQAVDSGSHDDTRLSAIWGGETEDGDSHWVMAASYFERDPLLSTDRDYTAGTAISFTGQPATYLFADGSGRAVDPACGTAPGSAVAFGFCTFDFSDYFDLSPKEERLQFFSTLTHDISDKVTASLEFGYSQTEVEENSSPSYPYLYYNPLIPISNPAAQFFGQEVLFKGRIRGSGSGPTKTQQDHNTYRLAGNIDVTLTSGWYWTNSLAYSVNDGYYDRPDTLKDRVEDAFAGMGGPSGDQTYNPLFGADNSTALIDYLFGSTDLHSEAALLAFDSIVSGDLINIRSGAVAAAFAVHVRRETLDHDWGDDYNNNQLISLFGGPDYSADRDIYAIFTEFSLPLSKTLEMQLAARYEDYGDGVNSLDPKLALLWRPIDTLSFRASVGTAFRAPSLFQTVATQTSTPFVNDPATGQNNIFVVAQAFGNNDLDPETANVYNIGFTSNPIEDMELSLDYWRFEYEDVITKENAQQVINANNSGKVVRDGLTGTISRLNLDFINAASVDTDGLDLTFVYAFNQLSLSSSVTYVNSYDLKQSEGAATINGVGSRNANNVARALPRIRGNLSLSWSHSIHEADLIVRYIHDYNDDATGDEPIDAHTTLDIRYSLSLNDLLSNSETVLSIGGINITDEEPPEINTLLGYDTKVHDPRGRMWYVNIKQAF
jgi:iron complex outermembrane recepter protein